MTRRTHIKSVLYNFLGTYTSRYSDYGGYWLFGRLVRRLGELRIDLLNPNYTARQTKVERIACWLAVQRFREQMEKAGIPLSRVRKASLEITRLPDPQSRSAVRSSEWAYMRRL